MVLKGTLFNIGGLQDEPVHEVLNMTAVEISFGKAEILYGMWTVVLSAV